MRWEGVRCERVRWEGVRWEGEVGGCVCERWEGVCVCVRWEGVRWEDGRRGVCDQPI